MREEFLFNCEKEITEANLYIMCGQYEEGIQIIREVSLALMEEIANSIQPITKNTRPYVIAALRTLANGMEKQLDKKMKETAKFAGGIASTIEFRTEKE